MICLITRMLGHYSVVINNQQKVLLVIYYVLHGKENFQL